MTEDKKHDENLSTQEGDQLAVTHPIKSWVLPGEEKTEQHVPDYRSEQNAPLKLLEIVSTASVSGSAQVKQDADNNGNDTSLAAGEQKASGAVRGEKDYEWLKATNLQRDFASRVGDVPGDPLLPADRSAEDQSAFWLHLHQSQDRLSHENGQPVPWVDQVSHESGANSGADSHGHNAPGGPDSDDISGHSR